MTGNLNQNVLMMHIGILFICSLLMFQPVVNLCLKMNDTISLIEADVDIENETEESNIQAYEKVLSFKTVYQIEGFDGEYTLKTSNIFTQNYWVSHSQDIFIHPPEFTS